MSREVCEHGNWLESPCYYCQTKPPFSPVIAAKDARIAELEAAIARDMGGDYLSLQALYVRQIATLAQRNRELLALRKALEHMGRCAYCAEDSWEDCEGGRQALAALASTAQAADEAERKILEAAWERVNHMPGDGITVGWGALKAKILGTESGEARPTPEPHREPGWGHALGCPFNGLDVLECSYGMPNAPVSGEAQP